MAAESPDGSNISARLAACAARFPRKSAVVSVGGRDSRGTARWDSLTFEKLNADVDALAAALRARGLAPGTRTIVMIPPGIEFFLVTFALFRAGAVPVMIDPGMGVRGVVDCLRPVEAGAMIGVVPAMIGRLLFPSAFSKVKLAVSTGARGFWADASLPALLDEGRGILAGSNAPARVATASDDTAAILFTSGSTGPAKGVVYTHGIFDAQVRALESHYGYAPDEIDVPTFPLFALFDAALGMTSVLPDMDFRKPGEVIPDRVFEAVETWGATHMFGSPALLRRVGEAGRAAGRTLPTLKRVLTAGAPVDPRILELFDGLLPATAHIHTPYGATESLPVASVHHRELAAEGLSDAWRKGAGLCVGRPVGEIEVRVVPISDAPLVLKSGEPLPEVKPGEVGEFAVCGPVVTREYYRRPDATAAAKVHEGSRVWHRMGDVGRVDERGRLWYFGRKSQRVVAGATTLFTEPVESVVRVALDVPRAALVGIGAAPMQKPVVWVEAGNETEARKRLEVAREALRAAECTREIAEFLFAERLPVDIRHNAKIRREELARLAARRLGAGGGRA